MRITPKRRPDKTPAGADRRAVLRGGAALAAGGAAATALGGRTGPARAAAEESDLIPDWTRYLGAGVTSQPYGLPSDHEKDVIRRTVPWLTRTSESSISFTPLADLHGVITPNGLHFERHHSGYPDIDPARHKLLVHGMVERPLEFTLADLLRLPQTSRVHFIECPANSGMEWRGAQMEKLQFTHGMVSCCEWTGVSLRTLLQEAGIDPKGKWMLAEGADSAAMSRSIPLEKALDDCLVAYAQNGEMLRREQGYPVRLVVPGFEGNMNVKWLRRLEIGDKPWHHREETSKYTDLMPDGKARRFTWLMEAKSVITSPSPEKPVNGKGFFEIRGLAWSGAGKITRVDVSVDGGRNWQTAELEGPVHGKALTRFRLPWEWTGQPHLLQSRAIDETGYVQPTLKQLRAERGMWSIYHNNAVHTWHLTKSGEVENVQLS